MSATPLHILNRLHPFYVASNERDLDLSFEDGKHRYIRSLECEIEQVKNATRQDYESAFLGRAGGAK